MNEIFKSDIDAALGRFPALAVALWLMVRFVIPALQKKMADRKKGEGDLTEHQVGDDDAVTTH